MQHEPYTCVAFPSRWCTINSVTTETYNNNAIGFSKQMMKNHHNLNTNHMNHSQHTKNAQGHYHMSVGDIFDLYESKTYTRNASQSYRVHETAPHPRTAWSRWRSHVFIVSWTRIISIPRCIWTYEANHRRLDDTQTQLCAQWTQGRQPHISVESPSNTHFQALLGDTGLIWCHNCYRSTH